MNLKQFLKPDWRKIILLFIMWAGLWFFIVLLKGGIYPEFHFVYVPAYGSVECKMEYYGLPFVTLVTGFTIVHQVDCPIEYYLINIIGNLLTSYFLSCLIVWIYDKFRKRK